ncbi:Unknown protein [Striga hermonthica]|uniref:Uncharacterized protein n=1 Tax=Striga hermonthica TaxID=68872 RepID=A0A9N7NH57_STRHE|nr:Unknown protein [Striga hermonthica]
METMDDMASIFKGFGDEQSTLFDKYERLSFEVHLNQAILGRSFSEPAAMSLRPPPKQGARPGKRGLGSGFQKVIKKLLSPILGSSKGAVKDAGINAKDPMFLKTFCKSQRA